jgi:6-phosphogluconolactonase
MPEALRPLHWLAAIVLLALPAAAQDLEQEPVMRNTLPVYIGTYTHQESRGIYHATFDADNGTLSEPRLVAEAENPSWLGMHPDLPVLYAVCETGSSDDRVGGTLRSYAIEDNGDLRLIASAATMGDAPCHLSVSPDGQHVAVANYTGGNVAVFPVDREGRVGEAVKVIQHEGSGPTARQQGPHAHAAAYDLLGDHLLVADLGIDQVRLYQIENTPGILQPNDPPAVDLAPGAGPRHIAVHPTGDYIYVVNELDNTVTAFDYNADEGRPVPLQTVTTLPEGFDGNNSTAEIVAHPNGEVLYASNRGHDSIAIFALDPDTGRLTPRGHTSTGGSTPRNFNLDPSGTWLLAANQEGDSITTFKVDPGTGALTPAKTSTSIDAPVCILFVQ